MSAKTDINDVMTKILALDASIKEQAMLVFHHARNETPSSETYPLPVSLALSEATQNIPTVGGGAGTTPRQVRTDLGDKYALPPFTFFQDPNLPPVPPTYAPSPYCVCVNPVVIVGETRLEVKEPDSYLISKNYYCHVYRQGDVWEARIDDKPECEDGDPTTRVCVQINEAPRDPNDVLKQLHTGAIVLGSTGRFLASFAVYSSNGSLLMYHPMVSCPPDTVLEPEAPALGEGTYYCHVWRTEWSYGASIDQNPTRTGSSNGKAVLDVKICTIARNVDTDRLFLKEQYHVGVVCADARTGIEVSIEGDAITEGEGGSKDVSRHVTFEFSKKILDKLGMEITASGQGRDGSKIKFDVAESSSFSSESESGIPVITKITRAEIDDSTKKIVLHYKTRKIRKSVFIGDESSSASSDLMNVFSSRVVIGSSWATPKFKNRSVSTYLLEMSDSRSDSVFTAEPHSECGQK